MSEAYIYMMPFARRAAKEKKTVQLHAVKPISLLTGLLNELQNRHQFDTAAVDDIVLGCANPHW